MKEEFLTINKFSLNNNCPECYSQDGLLLVFKQKVKENKLYRAITPEITHNINCKTCNTTIYPVQWTDDIERVFNYHQKAITPKKTTTKYKRTFWLIIISVFILTALIAGVVYITSMP